VSDSDADGLTELI